jgi:type II secretory pathway component PulJ
VKRGVTVLEVTVASGLALVALSLTATLLYATSSATARNQVRVDLQQQAVRAVGALTNDLSQCTPRGVGLLYASDPDFAATVACLHKVAEVNNTDPPAPLFDRHYTVYWAAEGSFYTRRLPDGQPPTLAELGLDPLSQTSASRGGSQGNLLQMVSRNAQGRRRLAESVTAFQIGSGTDLSEAATPYQPAATPPSVTNPVSLCLILEKEVKGGLQLNAAGNPCERFRLQRTVWFRDAE